MIELHKNKAVILSNHYRTLEDNWSKIKKLYGPNTDYYISTYSTNYRYETRQEAKYRCRNKLLVPPSYTDIETDYISFIKKEIKPIKYEIIHIDQLYRFINKHNLTESFGSIQYVSGRIGQIWSKYRAYELFRSANKQYDLVIFNRCDALPKLIKPPLYPPVTIPKDIDKSIFSQKVIITHGLTAVNELLFYGNQSAIDELFNNFDDKIVDLFKNIDYFKERRHLLGDNMLLGSLIQISDLEGKLSSNIKCNKIFKKES